MILSIYYYNCRTCTFSYINFIAYIVMNPLRVKQREWNVFVSGAAAGIALIMALERIPF